ncbi:MAG TPA: alpha/beta hydrolase-fold protein [Polyangiaceae bacterium]|nr:alpha/beta hydrolase-fold protein [Polyangiaceae bacterium]
MSFCVTRLAAASLGVVFGCGNESGSMPSDPSAAMPAMSAPSTPAAPGAADPPAAAEPAGTPPGAAASTPRVDEDGPTPVAPPVAGTSDDGAGAAPADPTAPTTPASAMPGSTTSDPGTEGDGDFVIGPDYPRDPDLTDRGAPRGRDFQFSMSSADSALFKGDDATLDADQRHPFTRQVNVYVPAKYVDGTAAPILVIHDGPGPLELVKRALDNLTISADPARRLPPFIAIAVANGGSDSKGSERGLEYDTMSDRFARFIDGEVLPAALANLSAAYPRVAFTRDPEGRATMGCSSGGAAALSMGWFRPDLFRRLITYSGTFVDQQDDDAAEEASIPLGAWDYHSGLSLIANSDPKPLRIFMHVSDRDNGFDAPEAGHHNWVIANQRTAAALRDQGYHYRFLYAQNAGHCSAKLYDLTLAETLLWAWRGYPNE